MHHGTGRIGIVTHCGLITDTPDVEKIVLKDVYGLEICLAGDVRDAGLVIVTQAEDEIDRSAAGHRSARRDVEAVALLAHVCAWR